MFRKFLILISFVLSSNIIFAQSIKVYGIITNKLNNDPIPFANIFIEGTNIGTSSDVEGKYEITDLMPGEYNFKCSYIGFKSEYKTEIAVNSNKNLKLDFSLNENSELLNEIEVLGNSFNKTEASPNSLRTISASEIYRSPGGNRDISKVIANFPGVSSSPSFRNDIIIRGGAPSENRFYLDGVEITNINHFATQGSSGGPVGILNVNFIREVDFYSGAFPANRGNALSSVMDLKQIEGNDEEFSGSFMIGSSDAGLTFNTPINKVSSLLFSIRRSYLQFLFKALKLPFLPTYNDLQFKYSIKPNRKNQINIIGLAAIDQFSLNKDVNNGIEDLQQLAINNYTLNFLPINEQWNYTIGITLRRFFEQSNLFLVASRSHLNNTAVKFLDYEDESSLKIVDYNSEEIEEKFRLEYNIYLNNFKINTGFNLEKVNYLNKSITPYLSNNSLEIRELDSDLTFIKYGTFFQISKSYFTNKLNTALGLRLDGNTFTTSSNKFNFSPRFSISYFINEKININSNIARYYQLPSYTILGYTENTRFINQNNKYISCDHAVLGFEINPSNYSKISIESFYKKYSNYPFSVVDNISLANLGADFGVIGNENVTSTSSGRTYGIELLAQQKLQSNFYGIMSLTYYKSEFKDKNDSYVPSSWDNRFILNLTAGKKFKRNIEIGCKFRFSGGAPYTPIDLINSSSNWYSFFRGLPDYNMLNSSRLKNSHAIDIRVDKKWFFNTWTLNIYFDVENIYNYKNQLPPEVGIDPNLGEQVYSSESNSPSLYNIENESGTILPSIGFLIEF